MTSTVTITGALAHPAEARAYGAEAHLYLWIDAAPGLPIEVHVPYGSGVAAYAEARRLAARWTRGMPAAATGSGLQPRWDHGLAVIKLMGLAALDVNGTSVPLR